MRLGKRWLSDFDQLLIPQYNIYIRNKNGYWKLGICFERRNLMKSIDPENEDQEISDSEESDIFSALISEIEGRCQIAKFNFEKTIINGFEEEGDQIVYKIEMPSGRYKRT